jgi:putative RNA 2'-phosphotransferase
MSALKRLSKRLALMLRHQPDRFGLILDDEGFTDVEAVFAALHADTGASRAQFEAVLNDAGGQQRYERRGDRIRARYGHSEGAHNIRYHPADPPEILYHGTYIDVLKAIQAEGLKSLSRQYVHLSTTPERAVEVATRHGRPILLEIDARGAQASGVVFYHPEAEHFLAKAIPPQFIRILPD